MSKSIKDYKSEMDSIEISRDFMKKTEFLLTETPSIRIEGERSTLWRRITTVTCTLAACVVLAFIIRSGRIENAFTKGIQDDIISYIPEASEEETYEQETESQLDLIIEIEDDSVAFSGFNLDDMPDIDETGSDSLSGNISDKTPLANPSPRINTFGLGVDTNNATVETEKIITNSDSVVNNESENKNTQGTGNIVSPREITVDSSGAFEINTEFTESIINIDFSLAQLEVIPYIAINGIESGMESKILAGSEAEAIAYGIAEITKGKTVVKNDSFKSIFSIRIYETITNEAYFDIYLTDKQSLVITSHNFESQQRTTYALSSSEFKSTENMLYLLFGSQNDYEAYSALKSGK